MISPIPIQNLYYIFCYAWNRLEESNVVDVGGVDSPEIADLFAKVLIGGIKHLIRRGIDRGYIPITEELSVLRGRVEIYQSMQLRIRRSTHLICEFDDFHHDILINQIIKATIHRLAKITEIDKELSCQLQSMLKRFDLVTEPRLSKQLFRQVQVHRNNAFYNFLLSLCELIYDVTLPEGSGDGYRIIDIIRDEKKMPYVFQDFIRNFFRIECPEYQVTPLEMRWDALDDDSEDIKLLPKMVTDIHLKKGDRRIIIDTKYYKEALQEHHDKKSVRSDNLYQLFSYLKNSEALESAYLKSEGILLYPAVGEKLSFRAIIQGHPVYVKTINLDQPWQDIRSDLISIVQHQ